MPASFNLFRCPVYVCVVLCFVLYCVCRGGGSIPPVSFCTGVLPRFCMNGTRLCCLAALHHPTGGWPFILHTKKKQGPEEMCLLEYHNPSKTSEKMSYFNCVTVSLHILQAANQDTESSQDQLTT